MKKLFLLPVMFFCLLASVSAQQVIHACCDTSICTPGASVTLQAIVDSGFNQGSIVSTVDDQYTGVVDLGFNFNFFGADYHRCILSTNFYISFDTTDAGLYSPWPIPGTIPSTGIPMNTIMGPWHDTYVGAPGANAPGVISYGTFGTAPNRIFVLSMCDVPMFQCVQETFSGQIILHETTNTIEMQILHKDVCSSWNGGLAIEGVQDPTGTIAYTVPGRNATQWTCDNDGYLFTPVNATTYSVSTIPFQMVPFVAGAFIWTDLAGNLVGNGNTITVNPLVTTSYVVSTGSCGNTNDTVTITVGSLPVNYAFVNASCPNSTDGAAYATPAASNGYYTFVWQDVGGNTIQTHPHVHADSLFHLSPGTYSVIVTDSTGCTATHTFNISNSTLSSTYSQIMSTCPAALNAWAAANPNGATSYSFVWQNGSGTTVQTDTGVAVDTLHNIGVGTYTVTITSPMGCTTTHTFVIQSGDATASFSYAPQHICAGGPVNFSSTSTVNSTTITAYHWSFGDNTFSTQQSDTHTYNTPGNYTVQLIITMNGGCNDTTSQVITIWPNIIASFSVIPDSVACVGQMVNYADGSNQSPVLWNWVFGDGGTASASDPGHVFNQSGIYLVQLSVTDSLCGTDTAAHYIRVYDNPMPHIGNDTAICTDQPLLLHANSAVGLSYLWNTGATTESIEASPNVNAWYTVLVNNHGCLGEDSMHVTIDCNLFMPSAFSPNGDGSNDVFRPRGAKIQKYHMMIYNRWGQKIYDAVNADISEGWDGTFKGKPQDLGVYVYYIDAEMINADQITQQGNVTLVR